MDFTKLDGFKTFYYLILLIIFIAIMWGLVKSAQASLKRTGGKITSILDEVVVGIIVMIAFIIVAKLEPSSVITFITKPLNSLWDLLLKALRFVGIKI